MNSLHPFAVTTYLPYNRKTNKQKEKSESSSTCTFSSTETEDSSPSEADEYDTISSGSSLRESFEKMEGAPKCHRGHTHVINYFDEEHNHEAAGEHNEEQDQN